MLTVRGSTKVPKETLRYDRLLICTEMLPAHVAADRLRAGTTSSIKALPEGLALQPEGLVQPVWVTTEPDQHRVYVITDWPGWYLQMGIAGGHLAGFNDLFLPADARRQRCFPNGLSALTSMVYGTPPLWMNNHNLRHVIIWLADSRIRLGDVRYEKGEVRARYEVGARLSRRVRVKAAWRMRGDDVLFQHKDVQPVENGGWFACKTDQLPAQFSVLVSDDGRLLDRRSWSEATGTPPLDESSLEAQMAIWLLEGEGIQLEYKERLGKEHNREFAETIAAFANSYGGVILLGVADDATVVGFDPLKMKDTVASIVRANVSEYIEPSITQVSVDGKPVQVIQVPKGERPPYEANGRVMVRAGATDRVATPEEIRGMVTAAAGPLGSRRGRR